MKRSSSRPHVVVVGAGILGVSAAAHLARAGASVRLVTSGHVADGASGRSISWLNSSGHRSAAYHYLRLLGIDRYRTWGARRPDSARYLRFDGALKWADASEGESFRDTFAFERSIGYDAVWLDRTDVARVAPDVSAAAIADEGAIFNPGEGWVHLPDLIATLLSEAMADGAEVIDHAGPASVDVNGEVAVGVILGDGTRCPADRVVLATGAGVPAQLAELGVEIPDATPAACVVVTEPVGLEVRTVLNTPHVAVRPTPDRRLVLDAGWAERSVIAAEDGSFEVPDATVRRLLDEASAVLAGAPALKAHRIGVGLKPIPGDGDPILGATPSIAGLHAMFTHSGATLGLIAGELIAEEVLTGVPSPVLDAFRVDRFTVGRQHATEIASGAWIPVAHGAQPGS